MLVNQAIFSSVRIVGHFGCYNVRAVSDNSEDDWTGSTLINGESPNKIGEGFKVRCFNKRGVPNKDRGVFQNLQNE